MTTLNTNKPKITQADINNGYVMRYFVRNVSTKVVTEIDKKQYETFKNNVLYEKLELQWRITGFANNILATDNNIIYGTKHSNTVTTQFYEKRLPGLQRILKNPLEYFQGTMNREPDTPINKPKYSSTLGGSVALGRTFGNEMVPPPTPTPTSSVIVLPTLTLSPTVVNFAFTQSASVPSTQYVIVTEASGSAVTGLTIQSQSSWVSASLNTTSTPASMSVIITTTNLATGSYTSSIIVSSSVSAISSTVVLPVTASVVEPAVILPDYWWTANVAGLTTSSWSASNGGIHFTLSGVTTASSVFGVEFDGGLDFGQTSLLTSNIAARHVLIRLDGINSNAEVDTILGGSQNNIHQIATSASGFWSILDAPPPLAGAVRYGVRTNTNIAFPRPILLWFDFENGTNAVNVYTDDNISPIASMGTYTGTFNNLFTWTSGSRIYLARRQSTTGGPVLGVTYGRIKMNVKELAIFTSSLSYEQGNLVRTQMLNRWNTPTTITNTPTVVNYAFTQSASVPGDWVSLPFTYSLAVDAVPVTQSIIITEVSGALVRTATELTIQSQSGWFSASLNNTSTPATMSIILKNTRLAPGNYTSSVTISSTATVNPVSNIIVVPVTASVLNDIEIQPEYWWRADSGLTTSGWTAYNGGLDFTFTNVTTASSAVGVVFNGTSGFGLTQNIPSNIAATHIFLRFDSASAVVGDSMMGGTQATNHSLNRVTLDTTNHYNITDISGSVTNYDVRSGGNLYNSRKLLWYDFIHGSDQGPGRPMTIYYDESNNILTNRSVPSLTSGTFNSAFTWISGSGIYLGRSGGASSFARMNVKEVAIFTTPLTLEEGAQFKRQLLRRWP